MKKLLIILLCAIQAKATDLTFVWTPSPTIDAALAYNFYWAIGASAPYTLYATTTNTTIVVTNLVKGVYRFYATATNALGESVPSNVLQLPGSKPGPLAIVLTTVTP